MFSVWRRVVLVVALAAACGLLAPSAQARTTAPDGTYVSCREHPSEVYIMVAGAPIYVTDFGSVGAPPSGQPVPIDCSTDGRTPADVDTPWYPGADGTFAQGWANGMPLPPVYEIVGGAPLWVRDWKNVGSPASPTVQKFDNASLPDPAGPERVGGGSTAFYGRFSALVRNAYFRSLSGIYYRTDSAGHPSVLPGPIAGRTAPIVDQNVLNACERMNCDPWGPVSVEVAGNGLLHLYGYALDGMTTQQLTVRVDLPGGSVTIAADQPDPEVGALYGRSGNYGFDRVISAPAGHYQVCTTFNGFAPGATYTPIGCSTVDVPGVKPARVHRPKVKAIGGHRLRVTWKAPNDGGSAISEYLLRTSSGVKKQISGTRHSIVLKHVPGGRAVSVKVRAINGVGMGGFSKPSAMVVVR